MNTPTLIFIAIAIPLTVIALLLVLSRTMMSAARRPRLRAVIFAVVGVVYIAAGAWEGAADQWQSRLGPVLQIAFGVLWIGVAVYEVRHGVPVTID